MTKEGNCNVELRDDDVALIELPSHTTKHGYYRHFIGTLGWVFEYDAKGRILSKVRLTTVDDDDAFPEEKLPGWRTFGRFWEKYYKHMVVPRRGADICDKCIIMANQILRKQLEEVMDDDENDDANPLTCLFVDEKNDDKVQAAMKDCKITYTEMDEDGGGKPKAKTKKMLKNESLVKSAATHVMYAQIQRDNFNQLKDSAYETAEMALRERCITLCADYAQNSMVPSLAGEQPGPCYYLAALNGLVFGVVDFAQDNTTMGAHAYMEYDGAKGGDNVASMLMHELKRKGLVPGSDVSEINLCFDNCPSQNKNRQVLRLLPILVNLRFCRTARAFFLVKGHTKNDCDRMYNLMKRFYRMSNCFHPKDFYDFIMNAHEDITLVKAADNGFFQWGKYEDRYMIGKVKDCTKHHVFTCTVLHPNDIFMAPAVGQPHVKLEMVKPEFRDTEWAANWEEELERTPPVGLRDIKWKELYDKWRPYVPDDKRLEFYPFHEAPGPTRRKKIKDNVDAAKEARVGRSITTDVSAAQGDQAINDGKKKKSAAQQKKLAEKVARQEAKAIEKLAKQRAKEAERATKKAEKEAAALEKRAEKEKRKTDAAAEKAQKKKK